MIHAEKSCRIRSSLAISAIVLVWAAATLSAQDRVDPVNKNKKGLALRGFDAVAYFDQDKAVKGSKQFTHEWNGATWRFAIAEHRDQFAADPERYAPQFGGYCAFAVSHGSTADAAPRAWTIVDGKLYLNYNTDVQRQWRRDAQAHIERAHRNWPMLHR